VINLLDVTRVLSRVGKDPRYVVEKEVLIGESTNNK